MKYLYILFTIITIASICQLIAITNLSIITKKLTTEARMEIYELGRSSIYKEMYLKILRGER